MDALRASMGTAEYNHLAFGLVFIKHMSDAFKAEHLVAEAIA